jgi:hypothetical protein
MNNRTRFYLCIILALSAATLACRVSLPNTVRGSGRIISEERQVSGFSSVSVGGGMQLRVIQGADFSCVVEAEDNLLPYILTEVEQNRLIISFESGRSYRTGNPIRITVSLPEVDGLTASGGSRIRAEELEGAELLLAASGGSRVTIRQLGYQRLEANLSGGSQAELAGQVEAMTATMSGGGQYRAEDLRTVTASVAASGGGEVRVWVEESLQADLSGGSRMDYYGSPLLTQNTSGGSTVRSRGSK